MSNLINRKRAVAALGGLAAVAIAVAAIAYWTGSGSGSGTGQVGTSGTVTLTGTVASGSAPGTSVAVSFTAENPGDSPIQISTVHLDGITVDSENASCETDDFSMADVSENHEVPANAVSEALPNNGSLVYANTEVSQDSCKGATLTLDLSSN
jgi:hypothetical protein